jgi:eukaryotic-like serine/threonine-protein kinase
MSQPVIAEDLTQLATGARFHGRYEVVRCIKTGGMGAVYEVIHAETRRRAALKVMLPSIVANADMRARFKLEMTVAADVESEHIVEIYDAGVDETGTPFIVMELLRGQELSQVFVERGRLPPEEVVLLLWQAALALDKTHAAGIVHRDLKPENLFITTRDDGAPRLKILDFGIAKVVARDASASKQTLAVGTPLYMSPEHIRGDPRIGPATDIYALAQIAYELIVGEAYWEELVERSDSLYSVLLEIAAGSSEPAVTRAARRRNITLPEGFNAWFARATAIAPEERYKSASELVRGLAEAFGAPIPRSAPLSLSGLAAPPPAPSNPGLLSPRPARDSRGALLDEPSISGVASYTSPVPMARSRPVRPVIIAAGAGIAAGIVLAIVMVVRSGGEGRARPDVPQSGSSAPAATESPSALTGSREPKVEPAGAPGPSAAPSGVPTAESLPAAGGTASAQVEKPTAGASKPTSSVASKPPSGGTAKPGPTSPPKDPLDDR